VVTDPNNISVQKDFTIFMPTSCLRRRLHPHIDAFWEPFATTRVNFNSVEYVRGRPYIVSMIRIVWEP
jgi:hypothetical protein